MTWSTTSAVPGEGSHGHEPGGVQRTLPYRPALDGLRGIAVVLVVVYHFRPDVLGGGFVGVDVFFVLSGFLIGSLLLREAEQSGGVDLRRFVVRRVRRLAPAMLLMLAAMALYAVTWANPFELARLRVHGLWALVSLANWKFIAEGVTYTDLVAGASPLRHVWSLAIEEQFYVALPIAVWLLARLGHVGIRRTVLRLAVVLGLLSAGWAAWLNVHGADIGRTYFGTDTRAQALLVGVALGAVLVGGPVDVARRRIAAIGAAVGAMALAVMAAAADEHSSLMPRGGFLLVAGAAALVIAGAEHLPPLRALLSTRVLRGLGAVSYGVYLWHWPVAVIIDGSRTGLGEGSAALLGVRLAVTFAAALLSFWLVERPIRRGGLHRRLGRRGATWSWAAAMATVAAVLVTSTVPVASANGGRPAAAPTAEGAAAATGTAPPGSPGVTAPDAGPVEDVRSLAPAMTALPALPDGAGASSDPGAAAAAPATVPVRLVMFGDSVAHSLAGGEVLSFPNVAPWTPEQATAPNLTSAARPGCSFLPGLVTLDGVDGADLSPFCGDWRHDLAAAVDAAHATQVALLLVNDMSDRIVDGTHVEFGSERYVALLDDLLTEVRSIVSEHGAELVLLAAAPRAPEYVPVEGDRAAPMLDLLRQEAAVLGVRVISLADAPTTERFDGQHYAWGPAQQVITWVIAQLGTAP